MSVNRKASLLVAGICWFLPSAFVAAGEKPGVGKLSLDYHLVWSDEFSVDGSPDPEKWAFESGFKRNHELQWYQPQNAMVQDGLLTISAHREQIPNPDHDPDSRDWRLHRRMAQYSSSSLLTRGLASWQYGRFEIRAKIDSSPGSWPAFWTLGEQGPWPHNGEIDIMEYYTGTILANVAWGTAQRGKAHWDSVKKPLSQLPRSWTSEFHVWRMDWDKHSIRLYVDDLLLNETLLHDTINPDGVELKQPAPANPFHQPHFIILNLAVGGDKGGEPQESSAPITYQIDYVRVYQTINS